MIFDRLTRLDSTPGIISKGEALSCLAEITVGLSATKRAVWTKKTHIRMGNRKSGSHT
jgi:hypothetical protein